MDNERVSYAKYQGLLAKVNASLKIAHLVGEDHWQHWSHDEVREQVYSLMNQMEDLAGREFVDYIKATKDIETSDVRSNRGQRNSQENYSSRGRDAKHVHNLGAEPLRKQWKKNTGEIVCLIVAFSS